MDSDVFLVAVSVAVTVALAHINHDTNGGGNGNGAGSPNQGDNPRHQKTWTYKDFTNSKPRPFNGSGGLIDSHSMVRENIIYF